MGSQASSLEKEELAELERLTTSPRQGEHGRISLEELHAIPELAVNPLAQRIHAVFDLDGAMRSTFGIAFRIYDVNGDGLLDTADLTHVVKLMVGSNVADIEVEKMVQQTILDADTLDRDGSISFAEFKRAMFNADMADPWLLDTTAAYHPPKENTQTGLIMAVSDEPRLQEAHLLDTDSFTAVRIDSMSSSIRTTNTSDPNNGHRHPATVAVQTPSTPQTTPTAPTATTAQAVTPKKGRLSFPNLSYSADIRPLLTPWNILSVVLLLVIVVSGAILFMALVGMLTFSSPSIKSVWIEVNSQILNAIFTFNVLVVQPERIWLIYCSVKYWRALRRYRAAVESSTSLSDNDSSNGVNSVVNNNLHKEAPSLAKPPSNTGPAVVAACSDMALWAARIRGKVSAIYLFDGSHRDRISPNNGHPCTDMPDALGASAAPTVVSVDHSHQSQTLPVAERPSFTLSMQALDTVADTTESPPSSRVPDAALSLASPDTPHSTELLISTTSTPFVPFWKWATILALLNGQCLFQYAIDYAMWGWATDYTRRPPYIVGLFLPLSFISGVVGVVWPQLIARRAKRRSALYTPNG
ncbi:hypothetical protein BSLG_007416 [Batrachochytrium salamandrivorans]|nr:hypothetical protein BSLG_007416 [Batrachochytrium salamandrivorans]